MDSKFMVDAGRLGPDQAGLDHKLVLKTQGQKIIQVHPLDWGQDLVAVEVLIPDLILISQANPGILKIAGIPAVPDYTQAIDLLKPHHPFY
jgi:hypothetical protein